MRPVRAPSSTHISPTTSFGGPKLQRPVPGKHFTPSTRGAASPVPSSVRYVDIRVAIPAAENSPALTDNMMQFIRTQSPSPMTVNNSSSSSSRGAGTWTPPVHGEAGGGRSRPTSPYAFVPIGSPTPGSKQDEQQQFQRSGGFSPYTLHKPGAVSPSMMSILTEDTEETASLTLGSRTTVQSPTVLHQNYLRQHRSSPYPGSRPKTPNSGKRSPFPKSLSNDDDSVRRTRIKTELCLHWSQGNVCPFGAQCTYAHGEEELQMTRLMDLHKAGLVDKDTYRIKPCLTWVATGSCPFGKRCTCIHDPRVEGEHASWLPHTETQGNTMATDINVEALHVKRLHTILHGNPFGNQFCLESDSWSDLYKLVCNIDYLKNGWVDKKRQKAALNPIVKLQIALLMRGGDAEWQYKYRPQHVIHDELCMVLQKRAFRVTETNGNHLQVREISLQKYKTGNPQHVLVRELAFGPDSDPSVRGVSLWFTIREDDVVMCTPQQAKRYRFKRSIKKNHDNNNDGGDSSSVRSGNSNKPSVFDSLDSFAMIRPQDRAAFDLVTDMMKHRLNVTQTERISNMRERFVTLQGLEDQKNELQMRFENLQVDWKAWAWPINKGREHVNKKTPVPKVDGKYTIEEVVKTAGSDDDVPLGKAVRPIWESFVATDFNENLDDDIADALRHFDTPTPEKQATHKLAIFETLARGMPLTMDRSLPHITEKHLCSSNDDDKIERPHSRQQERCWKALMLEPSADGGMHEANEWDAVREHFANSRSKKVLSIIQQKK